MKPKDKDKWINTERERWARAFSVPMCNGMPPNFPPLTLHIMRALCAIQYRDGESQDRLLKALDALFHEYWVKKNLTHKPETLKSVLDEILGPQEAETGR